MIRSKSDTLKWLKGFLSTFCKKYIYANSGNELNDAPTLGKSWIRDWVIFFFEGLHMTSKYSGDDRSLKIFLHSSN